MQFTARKLGLTLAASLGLHGLTLLAAAWIDTVFPTLRAEKRLSDVNPPKEEESTAAGEVEPETEDVAIIFTAAPEPPKAPPEVTELKRPQEAGGKSTVIAREDQPALAPLNPDTPFISSRNMRASNAGSAVAGADPNKITQDGLDRDSISLTNEGYTPGEESGAPPGAAQPAADATPPAPPDPVMAQNSLPAPPPSDSRPPEPTDQPRTEDPLSPAPAPKPDKTIALRETQPQAMPLSPNSPTPAPPRPRPQPKPPSPVARNANSPSPGQRARVSSVKSKSVGSISNRGEESSVDARETAEGRYNSQVHQRIGLIWNARLSTVRGLAGLGSVEVDFEIDATGRVSNVKLVDAGKANPILEDVCLTSIIKAKLPPPPEEMLRELRDPLSNGKLRRRFTFHRL